MKLKKSPFAGEGQTHSKPITSGILVNGFLTKKRVRVEGKQVMGYTAKGLPVEVLA